MKKKKWFYIICIILASALILTGIIFLFVINYDNQDAGAIEVIASNSKTYLKTSLNENPNGYIFLFESDGKEIVYESSNNMLCADNLIDSGILALGKTYNISVCYKNEYENGYSNYSENTKWQAVKYLSAPQINVYSSEGFSEGLDEFLTWDAVPNADRYMVYYSNNGEVLSFETRTTKIVLSELIGGTHNFYVVAKSDKNYYLDSTMSNTLSATYYHEVKPFSSVKYNSKTKVLIVGSSEDINDLSIWVGTNRNDTRKHDFSFQEGGSTFLKNKTAQGYEFVIYIGTLVTEETTYVATKPNPSGYSEYNGDYSVATII